MRSRSPGNNALVSPRSASDNATSSKRPRPSAGKDDTNATPVPMDVGLSPATPATASTSKTAENTTVPGRSCCPLGSEVTHWVGLRAVCVRCARPCCAHPASFGWRRDICKTRAPRAHVCCRCCPYPPAAEGRRSAISRSARRANHCSKRESANAYFLPKLLVTCPLL